MYVRKTLWVLLAVLLAMPVTAYGGYRFTPIAETVDWMGPVPTMGEEMDWALNNAGQVVFDGRDEDQMGRVLYRGDGQSLTRIAPSWLYSTGDMSGNGHFDMNDAGTVIFTSGYDGSTMAPDSAYTTQNGVSFQLVLSSDTYLGSPSTWPFGSWVDGIGPVSINNAGVIAFEAMVTSGDGMEYDRGLYTRQPGGDIQALFSVESDAFHRYGPLSINNAGDVTFRGNIDDMGSARLFQSTVPNMFKIIDGKTHDFWNGGPVPSANDAGMVAFSDTRWDEQTQTDVSELVLSDGYTRTVVLSMQTMEGFDDPAVNNEGQVAFELVYWDEQTQTDVEAIYAGPDLVADKVIARGDSLFGMGVQSVEFSTRGLNDSGQIAFWAELYNSDLGLYVHGLYLADPVILGDFNVDGQTNLLDIEGFTAAILDGGAGFLAAHPDMTIADIDPSGGANPGDPVISLLDIPCFVQIVTGGGQAVAIPEPTSLGLLSLACVCLLRRRGHIPASSQPTAQPVQSQSV